MRFPVLGGRGVSGFVWLEGGGVGLKEMGLTGRGLEEGLGGHFFFLGGEADDNGHFLQNAV